MAEKTSNIPVECLSGQAAIIWFGWRSLGDRELIREASIKGTHINLAYKCLAYRKNISVEDAQSYFNIEVETWIVELLRKHQVHRASHILKNLGKSSVEYIANVCVNCIDSPLRDYLSEYLINIGHFKGEHTNSCNLIKSIRQHEQKYKVEHGISSSLSILKIMRLPEAVKQALSIELYFSITDRILVNNITNYTLWDYLLSNNKIDLIEYWIDSYYGNNEADNLKELNEEYKYLFQCFDIVPDMIESIDASNASTLVKELTKNHLCRYGVLLQSERTDLKLTLARIFGSSMTISEFKEILERKSCGINATEFTKSIDKELCVMHCLYQSNDHEDKAKVSQLYDAVIEMFEYQEPSYDTLIEGILKTVQYLSDDMNEYLKQHYMIVLALISLHLFQKSRSENKDEDSKVNDDRLRTIFTDKSGLQLNNYNLPHEVLQSTLKHLPILKNIIDNKPKKEVTAYELLDGYKGLNVKQLYKWRFNNEPMPHFSNKSLVKKYGYTETLTYKYYLKEARPNMAIVSLKHAQRKLTGTLSFRRKRKAALYAHILALRNLDKPEILCSCISFIDMLSIDPENLRLHITAANYVHEGINVSIGNLLENVLFKNESDLKTVMSYLESTFQQYLIESSIEDSQQLINILKKWNVIVQFARIHNYSLPTSLLKFLANKNLWFEFVLVCDTFAYPPNEVLENTKHFEDAITKEHLLTCLNNTRLTKSQLTTFAKQKVKSRDARQTLYHKIGVTQSESSVSGSPVSTHSSCTSDTQSIPESIENDSTCSADDDVWSIILKCHQSPDPPGALIQASRITLRPFFIVLATCYEPSSTAAYCYSWMIISTRNENFIDNYKEYLEQQVWTANKVSNMLHEMTSQEYIDILYRACKIFMPDNPLCLFFEFLMQCACYGDFEESQQSLLDFQSRCSNLKCNKAMDWNCLDTTYLNNSHWIIITINKCLIATLAHVLRSTYLHVKFLELLTSCDFNTTFSEFVPNFKTFLEIIKILQKTNVTFNFAAFNLSESTYNINNEIRRCVNDLLLSENYESALQLSKVTELNAAEIIIAQYQSKFNHHMQKNDRINEHFWNQCASDFKAYNVSYEKTVEFFIEHAEKVTSHKERYEILSLAFDTLKNVDTQQENLYALELAMWKSCILAGPENIQLNTGPRLFNKLKTELLSGLSKLKYYYTLNNEQEKEATKRLIDKLIDTDKLDIALRISTIFNYKHKDLEILMLCLTLAEGEITPNELTNAQQNLLKEANRNKHQKYSGLRSRGLQRLSSSFSLTSSIDGSETSINKDENAHKMQMECLSILQQARDILEHGLDISQRVILCYKLSMELGKSYHVLLMLNNPIQFLQEVTESDIQDKSAIVNDIILAYKISNETIARFLAENISLNISRAADDGHDDNIYLWGYSLNTNFRTIMELCADVSLLGWQLLKIAYKLLGRSNNDTTNVPTLKTIAELLIRAHDCFTTSCNMEGIASVLRKCQNLANILQNLKYWALLVRLVTGVGRFTEMNYIFQILKENDQFEFLLGKGLDKVAGLKTALLEFLKRHCPENKDLFTLVALHFRLYHEIAVMWENEAKDVIKSLISDATKDCGKFQNTSQHEIKFIRTEYVQKQLQLALINYTHATQYYLQAEKLNVASQCSNQVQLVSLQLSLLGAVAYNQQVINILELKFEDMDKILCHHLSFPQAVVMIHAYNYSADWASLIYNHCILNGETKYLKDFIAVNKLTSCLVQDCARRYRLEKSITHTMTDNMKILISEMSDVECKYILASHLGFKDIVEVMLNKPMIAAYLKDVVWKKGHNAS